MKKLASVLLSTLMAASLVACGTSTSSGTPAEAPAEEKPAEATAEATAEAAPAGDEGKVLNIYCWNGDFQGLLANHYKGYEKISDTQGKIGDVEVNFIITPSTDNAYQNKLDELLPGNAEASADEKVDIFLIEADYAGKYTAAETPVALDVKGDLGLTDADLANQFQYTKDVVTSNGVLRGVSWQACPGGLIYRRDIAKEVFGSDDPETIAPLFDSWDKFNEAAEKLKAAGYTITCSANDSYRVYSNNVTSKWVEDGKINIDPNIQKWVEDSKALVDAGETGTYGLWGDEWNAGFMKDGKVFSYFGPAWLINFCMAAGDEGSVAHDGGWAVVEGPQTFNWGGTWICGAVGTDNQTLVADIMKTLTCDDSVMLDITRVEKDFVNTKSGMTEAGKNDEFAFDVLGGQNPLTMFTKLAENIDMTNISDYDQGCTEEFQNAMKNYFDGNATYDEALANFYKAVGEKYPELAQ